MFLGRGQSLVGIDLEEGHVEDLRGGIRGAVTVFSAGVDAAVRGAIGRAAGPGGGLLGARIRRSEAGTPYRPLAILTIAVAGRRGFNPVRLRVLVPAARRDIQLLKRRARGNEFGTFDFRFRL